nr:hypothetical protein CFP56_32415 [Quercus suber]
MSGTEATYHLTKEDVKKSQGQESRAHGGDVPAGSAAAGLQSLLDKTEQSKAALIEERKANLPLPDDPPTSSDFNSSDARTVNVGSGSLSGNTESGLRDPSTGDSSARVDGNSFGVNTAGTDVGRVPGGIPNDAVTRDAKDKAGLEDTTNQDKGYPQKSDPSSGL